MLYNDLRILTNQFFSKYDFDAPEAIDINLVVQVLSDLKSG